ncbi:hypothetical protein AMTR_s00031p00086240 [Amborella trichopoda]|uniref:Uncharacterized protein n=1 Tax=Amborella trichopoda TaxID=13333 RepID=U5D540_AMBTC|nr:hypothetical protein AMTR_s00031p00086240 [Amborella trichopoda]
MKLTKFGSSRALSSRRSPPPLSTTTCFRLQRLPHKMHVGSISNEQLPLLLFLIALSSIFCRRRCKTSDGERERTINTPTAVDPDEGDKGFPTNFTIVGLAFSSEEALVDNIAMSPEERVETGMMLDPKSREITTLKEMVVCLRRDMDHHQNMFDFYREEVERVKDLLSSVRRKLARVNRQSALGSNVPRCK